jgi:hypothetical protein
VIVFSPCLVLPIVGRRIRSSGATGTGVEGCRRTKFCLVVCISEFGSFAYHFGHDKRGDIFVEAQSLVFSIRQFIFIHLFVFERVHCPVDLVESVFCDVHKNIT